MMGSPNGTSRRSACDRWFRYPAGFSEDTLNRCFRECGGKSGLIIDPFAGVATTGTRAVREAFPYRGIEAHPLIAEIAALKFRCLEAQTALDLDRYSQEMVTSIDRSAVATDGETSLVRRSFTEETLKQLITLRDRAHSAEPHLVPYLRCALVGTLRDVASVKVGWPHQRPALARRPPHRSVPRRFRERVKWMIEDLAANPAAGDARIIIGDSRTAPIWRTALGGEKAQFCVSSPPYLNNFDYADATRLELYFIGTASTWAELCSNVRANMITATTQQSTKACAEAGWRNLKGLPGTTASARKLALDLEIQRRKRPRGKEYNQMLPAYLSDISQVLSQAHDHLAREAVLAWVVGDSAPYGVYIDTPGLISGMAAEIGFEPLKDIFLRRRGSRWAQNGTRHQLALSERLIVMRCLN